MASKVRRAYTYVDDYGEEKRVIINGATQAEADKKFQDLLMGARSKKKACRDMTLQEFVDEVYWPRFTKQLKTTTTTNYSVYLSQYILPYFGDRNIDDVTVADIQAFYDYLAEGKKHGYSKNINRDTIRRIGGLLGRIFGIAEEMGVIDRTPMLKRLLAINAEEGGHHKALPGELVDKVKRELVHLEDDRERIYMALLAYTGMRKEEILGLRWEDVNWEDGTAHIVRAVTYAQKSTPTVSTPKTKNSARYVILVQPVMDVLTPLKKTHGYILGGDAPLCYSTSQRIASRAFKKLGLEGYNNHDWRTTFGTQLKERGVSTALIADLMGHADTRMVETVYARTRKEGIVGQKAMLEEMNREYLCDKNAG